MNAGRFSEAIMAWYSVNKRDLPWRNTKNPYKVWLSEIMLQQTRVDQGMPYYLRFLERFPRVEDLASASEQEVLQLWQGLGYYSRARNLHQTARWVVREGGGEFPGTFEGLKKLKGVGDYTASAIASFCFGLPHAVVDGNVYRLLSRVFGIATPVNLPQGQKEFAVLAQRLLDRKRPGDYNQAIMEFGALQCKPRNPDCSVCELQDICVARRKDMVESLPVKLRKGEVKKRYFHYLVVNDGESLVLEQRQGKDIWERLYQFPLVEATGDLSLEELLASDELKKALKEEVLSVKRINKEAVVHKLSHQHIYTYFWEVKTRGSLSGTVPFRELSAYPVPVLIANFVNDYGFNNE